VVGTEPRGSHPADVAPSRLREDAELEVGGRNLPDGVQEGGGPEILDARVLARLGSWLDMLSGSLSQAKDPAPVDVREPARARFLSSPFLAGDRAYPPVILVFLAINALVLVNAILHDPSVGYDADAHLAYIAALSRFRLPARGDTTEFFSAP